MLKSGKAEVVEMPPKMYLKEIAHSIFPKQYDYTTFQTALRGTSVKNINKYMRMMEEGVKFDTPYLDYRNSGGQEGRHRAIAAYMLGVKKIPVIIVK